MHQGWFRLCLFAGGSTATVGDWGAPAPGHLPFWFKPVSAFGLLEITAFISSSPELAMPSTLAPDRRGASSRRALSREARPPWVGEVTLSQELRTAGLLRPHVLVGYQWSHTGLRPGRKTSHNRYIRSFVSQPPWNRGDPPCSFPPWPRMTAGSDRFWLLELRVSRHFSTFYGPSVQIMDTQLSATSTVDPDDSPRSCSTNNLCR